jgi:uncharacterized membrane protein YcaP (DUF421 family)
VLRAIAIYLFLLLLFRLVGQRTLSELSTFNFILLLIVSEATQNALIGDDFSVVTGMTAVLTLVLMDLGLSMLKKRFRMVERVAEGTPLIIVEHGRVLQEQLRRTYVTEDDILQAARQSQGLERIDQIKYAVLETSGGISVIPRAEAPAAAIEQRIAQAVEQGIAQGLAQALQARGG